MGQEQNALTEAIRVAGAALQKSDALGRSHLVETRRMSIIRPDRREELQLWRWYVQHAIWKGEWLFELYYHNRSSFSCRVFPLAVLRILKNDGGVVQEPTCAARDRDAIESTTSSAGYLVKTLAHRKQKACS